jgi:hypothetical protein
MQQQIVLGKEASEQQPVPMFVSHSLFEMADSLTAALRVELVAQLAAVGTKLIPQRPFRGRKRTVGLVAIHGQALQRLLGSVLGDLASAILSGDGSLKQAAKFSRKTWHSY